MWDKTYEYGATETVDSSSATTPDTDPLEGIYQAVAQKPQYHGEEQGVYHPVHSQTLKFRNNEMAELFVDKNNGIRMDPDSQTINVLANHLKEHLARRTGWITGNELHFVGGNQYEKVKGKNTQIVEKELTVWTFKDYSLQVDKDEKVLIKGKADVTIEGASTLTVKGNVIANIGGSATIETKGNMSVRSKKTIDIYAEQDVRIDAGRKVLLG
ncbi:hypothetical protein ACK8P5_25640 (plasmid) [Paenibacillus sp. EC2-1]|uniref:hypothetical protein n=1 Tax=Paenibacillus sp. EC2-1 TaxID=3388665 RepID=UPI003BEEB2AD